MNTSLQSSGGRHLAPAMPGFPIRVCVWEARGDDWRLAEVFECRSEAEASFEGLETCTEPYPAGVTAMHFVVGEVANG